MIFETLVAGHTYTVLSLPPIWAWAVLYAGKVVENLPFGTSHRGRLLVHAGSDGMGLREIQQRRAEVSFLSGIPRAELPVSFVRGALLGSIELLDCVRDAPSKWAVPGKYHWVLREPKLLARPIEGITGETGLWRWVHHPTTDQTRSRRVRTRSGVVPAPVTATPAEAAVQEQMAPRARARGPRR